MSLKKNLQNRLDDLFSDLENQFSPSPPRDDQVPGWTWECDPKGIFTDCSPEVIQVLGFNPQQFIGQSLFSFLLDAQSENALRNVFKNVDFPQDVELRYQTSNRQKVNVRTHIFPIESIDDTLRGWRGYNQVLSHEPTVEDRQSQKPALFPSAGRKGLQEGESIVDESQPATLSYPIELQEQFLGILEIIDENPNRFWSENERRLVEQVVDQLALALENARLFQETQNSLSRTEALYQVGKTAIEFEAVDQLLQAITDKIAAILPADSCVIVLLNQEMSEVTHFIKSNSAPIEITEITFHELMNGLSGWCIREQKPVFSPRGYNDPRESLAARKIREETNAASMIVVPLIYQDRVYGTLSAANGVEHPDFTQNDLDLLNAMSTQIAAALANASLFEEEQRRRRIATTLSETARVVGATLELSDVGDRLLKQLAEVIDYHVAALYLVDKNQLRLIHQQVLTDLPILDKLPWHTASLNDDQLLQETIKSLHPIVISDTKNDSRWTSSKPNNQLRSWIGAPLHAGENVIGVLFLAHCKANVYDDDTADFISAIAAQVSVAIRNAELFQQVQRRSIQLQTAAEVSRAANSILEPNPLIQQTVDLIQERFNLYYVGLFLVDETGEWTNEPGRWAVLRAGTGEAGRIQIERGHKLAINSESMVGECIASFTAQTPQSISENFPRYVNPLLPETKTEIALPLISRGQVIGAVSIQSKIEHAFGPEDVAILQTMADQVANALQNANLFNLTQVRAEELTILNQMSQALSQNLEISKILKNVYLYSSRLVDTSSFFIALYDLETNQISFPFAIEEDRNLYLPSRQLGSGLTEYVIHNQETVLIHDDVEQWLHNRGIELHLKGAMPNSWLGVPLEIGNKTLGIICVQNQSPNHFTDHHAELLEAIAYQSAIAIQNAVLFEQTQEALSDTQALLNITSLASSSLALQETLTNVLHQILETIGSEAGLITIHNPQSQKLELVSYHLPEQMVNRMRAKGLEGTLCHRVFQSTTPLVLENFSENSPSEASGALALGFQSYQGVPIEAKGRILGTLCTFSSRVLSPKSNDIKLLSAVGQQIGVAIENANLFEQTQKQASELTIMNEMSSILSTQLEVNEIVDTVYQYASRLIDCSHFFIAFYHNRENDVSFSLVIEHGENISTPPRKVHKRLAQYVIKSGEPLLIQGDADELIQNLGLEENLNADPHISWLGAPMIIGEEVLGVLVAQNEQTSGAFTQHHKELLSSVARQAAIAIQTARLFQSSTQQTEDLAVLNQMSRELTNILKRDQVYKIIYEYASRLMNTDNFFIALYDDQNQTIAVEFNVIDGIKTEGIRLQAGVGLTGHIIKTGEALLLEENILYHMEKLDIEIIPLGNENIPLSWLGAPMLVGEKVMGVIAVQSITTPRLFDQRHRDLLLSIASHAAISLQNVQLFDQVQSAFNETTALYQAGSELNAVQTYEDILRVLREHTILGKDVITFSMYIFEKPWNEGRRPEWYTPIARWSRSSDKRILNQRLPISPWLTSDDLLNHKEATLIGDIASDPRVSDSTKHHLSQSVDAKCLLFAPLVMAGSWFGIIEAVYNTPQSFSESEMRRMMTLVSQSAVAIQNLQSIEDSVRKAGQLEMAAEIARDSSATLSVSELLDRSVNAIRERFGYYQVSIYLLDKSNNAAVIRASTGEAGAELTRQGYQLAIDSDSVVGCVAQNAKPLVINDIGLSSFQTPQSTVKGTKAELGLPLKIGKNVIGVLSVQSDQIHAFHQDDILVLQTLADQISVALDNARSYQLAQDAIEETRRRVQDLTALSHVSQTLASAPLEIREVATIIAQQLEDVVSSHSDVSILLRDPIKPDQMVTVVSARRELGKFILDKNPIIRNFELSEFPATAEVVNSSSPLVIHLSDPQADPNELAYMKEMGIGTSLVLPLAVKGQTVGILKLDNKKEEYPYTPDEIKLLTTLANQAAISLENARLYEEQLETTEQLRELDKLKSQFLANMSHELRTPLNSIIGFSRVIMKGIDGPITDLQQQDLTAIYNAGQHLLKMINDILDISKIDAGKMELAFENVNIGDIINSVLSTARGLIRDKPIQLVTDIEENLPLVYADPTRIRQIFLNLLSNAAKFTDTGTITVTARQQISDSGEPELYLSVSDTGMGIAFDDQARLFEPFVQVDGSPTRSTGGTGLGLSITRMLVELHNGKIGLESDIGFGSTFFFTLPLSETSPDLFNPELNKIILAVDTDMQVIHLYERYLSGTDFQIIPIGDPSSVLAYAQEIQPFVITLDVLIQNHDGWQLLEDLKNHPETRDIPVVICSLRDEKEKAFERGAQDYLLKPILQDDFVSAIHHIWELVNEG
jgi:GAF domain-containing protein/CheY-like chemotaxis protein